MRKRFVLLFVLCVSAFLSFAANAGGKGSKGSKGSDAGRTVFSGTLSGAQSVTGNTPNGVATDLRGKVIASFNASFSEVRVSVRLNDASRIVATHFHCGAAGQNGPLGLGLISPGPLAVDGNVIRGTLTNADVQGGACEAAIGQPVNNLVSLAAAMEAGLIYLNVHTPSYPAGEVRAQMFD